jgi:hypothetical protein
MVILSQLLKYTRIVFCVLLLCIMGYQQWATFSRHKDKFLSPIEYTKKNYLADGITQDAKRYVELRKMFTKPTRLNYVGETDEWDHAIGEGYFAFTQYNISPNLILRDDVPCDTVLYNLYRSMHINTETNIYIKKGWHVVKDFNNGLVILAK